MTSSEPQKKPVRRRLRTASTRMVVLGCALFFLPVMMALNAWEKSRDAALSVSEAGIVVAHLPASCDNTVAFDDGLCLRPVIETTQPDGSVTRRSAAQATSAPLTPSIGDTVPLRVNPATGAVSLDIAKGPAWMPVILSFLAAGIALVALMAARRRWGRKA